MSLPARVATLVAWVACAGCTSGSGVPAASWPLDEVEAPGEPSARYSTDAVSGEIVRGDSDDSAARRAIEDAARAQGVALEGDARLAAVASWLAQRLGPRGELLPLEALELFARHAGLVETVPDVVVLGQPRESLAAGLASSVGEYLARQPYNRFGASVVQRDGRSWAVVLLQGSWASLTPIPRRVEPGATIALRGRLAEGYRGPTFVVAGPDGRARRLPSGGGPELDVRIPNAERGVYRVELVASGSRGDAVLASFPVYVGEAPPRRVRLTRTTSSAASSRDVEAVRRELVALLSATRREAGLGALEPHDGLGDVALAHALEMVELRFVGHVSPRTGTPLDRVRRAGLDGGLVLENVGRGLSAADLHRGFLESPGHRANLLNPDVTHVGIGVAIEQDGDERALVVTEVFTRMTERLDLAEAPSRLLHTVNRGRAARGVEPLATDERLAEAAQRAAERFFADSSLSQQDAIDEASAGLRRLSIAYRRVGGVMAIVTDVDDAGALEPTFDGDARVVGIGLAQGGRPDTGPNAIAVVFMLAWPR